MSIIVWLIVGLIAGWLAGMAMGGSVEEAAIIPANIALPLPAVTPMHPTRTLLAVALLATLPALAAPPARQDLTTVAERSGFVRTGRFDEVIALCDKFAQAYPDAVRCIDFGTTPEGRPMKALIVSRSGALTPEAAHGAPRGNRCHRQSRRRIPAPRRTDVVDQPRASRPR